MLNPRPRGRAQMVARPGAIPGICPYTRHTSKGRTTMTWTTPTLVEICIGLEINGYMPAEF
jgi:coenzyme PQQ precursor peptide PqqA